MLKPMLAILAAITAMAAGAPASAKVFDISFTAETTGYQITFGCPTEMIDGCITPYSRNVAFAFRNDLSDGENTFNIGGYYAGGVTTFTILKEGDYLFGRNLSFGYKSCSGIPPAGCYALSASAATFDVAGGVPEPATWAMLVAGFGMVGLGLRRRREAVRVRYC